MSQSSTDVAAKPLARSPPSSPMRQDPPDHVAVELKKVLREFEPDLGQPLSAALSWDFIFPELSEHILSKEQYLESHPEDSGMLNGVWDSIVQVLVRRKTVPVEERDTTVGTGFLLRRPPIIKGMSRPTLPHLVLAPLHLVADADPEQIMVRVHYNFNTDPRSMILLRCRRIFYSNLVHRESGSVGADIHCIGFALLEVTCRRRDFDRLMQIKPLEIENNDYKENFVMKNADSARIVTIGHRAGLPKSISHGYGVTIEQRGAKCWTVEYHSQSDLGSAGSLVLITGNVSVPGQKQRVNLGSMDYFVGLVHYGNYENGPDPTDIGVAFIPTAAMMRNLFAQLEQAYRFDVRDAAVALGLSVDAIGLNDHHELHCPADSLESVMSYLESSYIDSTSYKHDKHYPVYRSLRMAERWKTLYKAGTMLFVGVIILGLSFALLLALFRLFHPGSLRHPPLGAAPPPPPPDPPLPAL